MIIDIAIILVVGLSTFIGYKRGLIKAIVKILSFFIAIILAFTLCTPATNMIIEKTVIDDNIENAIVKKILPEGEKESQTVQIEQGLADLLKIDKEGTVKNVAHEFTVKIIRAVAILAIFVAVKLLLLVFVLFTDIITKLPVIKQFNNLGGTIYGFIKGVLFVLTIFAFIYVLTPMIDVEIVSKINDSILGKFIYNNNILLKLFFK